MRKRWWLVFGLIACLAALYVYNASWRVAPISSPDLRIIAHRGVHQTFDATGLGTDGCSAARIHPPTHAFLENTLPSMRAAFAAGADIVELDVHPTTDGRFAVMHDWTLECRTEAEGETRGRAMAFLKTLDIGYGYTADGGATYPFRGKGVGLMPELEEVLAAMPDRRFLVNFKSRDAREGDMLAALAARHPEWRAALWGAYGGDEPVFRAKTLLPDLNVWSRRGLVDCLVAYMALGWTGQVPAPCRATTIMIPINVAPWLWGWPDLLLARFRDAGTEVILLGPYEAGDPGTSGIDSLDELAAIPPGFSGYIWTNRIEVIGPGLSGR